MAAAAAGLEPFLATAEMHASRVPVVANYTAEVADGADVILRDLEAQVCGSVRWEESVRKLISMGITEFVECGPGAVLQTMMKRIDPNVTCLTLETHADIVKHADLLT
jgi:[acyl-carrier-protein] S-malonyltransferase